VDEQTYSRSLRRWCALATALLALLNALLLIVLPFSLFAGEKCTAISNGERCDPIILTVYLWTFPQTARLIAVLGSLALIAVFTTVLVRDSNSVATRLWVAIGFSFWSTLTFGWAVTPLETITTAFAILTTGLMFLDRHGLVEYGPDLRVHRLKTFAAGAFLAGATLIASLPLAFLMQWTGALPLLILVPGAALSFGVSKIVRKSRWSGNFPRIATALALALIATSLVVGFLTVPGLEVSPYDAVQMLMYGSFLMLLMLPAIRRLPTDSPWPVAPAILLPFALIVLLKTAIPNPV
jgi:hypothetical protein